MDELIFPREFIRVADLHSERRATIDLGKQSEFTFAQNRSRVTKLADAMRADLGLDKYDRFGVLLGNRHQYGELWHAGLMGAGVINPLNSRAHVDDIRYMLADSGAKVVFADGDYAGLIERCRADLPDLHTVVRVGDGDFAGDLDYDDLLEAGSDSGGSVDLREEDMAVLMYTGGTTGRPKGVVMTQKGVMLNWHRITESIRPTPDWATLQVVPLFHVGAFVALTLTHLSGGAIAYLPRWDAKAVLDAIEKFRLTGISAVPSMAVQLIEHPEFSPERVASLRFFGYGAAPMSEGLLRRLLDVLPPEADFVQAYGLTEAGGMVTVLDGADHRLLDADLLRSAGRPMAGFEVGIRATGSGEPVPTGATGEIWLRSGSIMREYWNRPEETAEALAEGWFHTGDVGYRDKRGYLWITDRAKDMIISGGENIFSIEVENAISTHPAVSEVAVIGRPHPLWGETVHAIVRLIEGHTVTAEEITLHARSRLSAYKVPRSVEIRSEAFPQSPAGKIRKNELRDSLSFAQAEPQNDGGTK
ncbi:class I adenylate-forming enzyme family protein [Arthrobacter sp. ISL-28]|uniref:class I adenylate-forming enzyme family protein n=1 Tax=Arthrobacter sp. ISL-28 TaxID=2819108 RepID=UPI001BE52220|nr:AMP-binding protein [Arthrobacter sp. ISL-28]MBT2523329.1 AMP-binding protein [Arthrobacter sp. ISL-28]